MSQSGTLPNVLWSVGKNNAKSMTVANGGNAI